MICVLQLFADAAAFAAFYKLGNKTLVADERKAGEIHELAQHREVREAMAQHAFVDDLDDADREIVIDALAAGYHYTEPCFVYDHRAHGTGRYWER